MPVNAPYNNDYPYYTIDPKDIGSEYYGVYHGGIDLAAPEGTPILSPFYGVVKSSNPHGSYGNNVVVQYIINGVEYEFLFAHMSSVSVNYGDIVYAGDQLGLVGQTGNAHGAHVHIEAYYPPYRYGQFHFNPMMFFNSRG